MITKFKKKKKGGSRKNIFFSVLFGVLFLLVMGFLIITNLKIYQRRAQLTARIAGLEEEINILEQKNQELEENISQAGGEEYLEKVAREQLGLKAPGEEVVVITGEKEKENEEIEEQERTWREKIKNIFQK